jgi:hypothetical protein
MTAPAPGSTVTIDAAVLRGTHQLGLEAVYFNDLWWTLLAVRNQKDAPPVRKLTMGRFAERGGGTWTIKVWTADEKRKWWKSKKGFRPL